MIFENLQFYYVRFPDRPGEALVSSTVVGDGALRCAFPPRRLVWQWALAVPKRLRHFVQRDGDVQHASLRILMLGVLRSLYRSNPGTAGLV